MSETATESKELVTFLREHVGTSFEAFAVQNTFLGRCLDVMR
ncbi:hypothetical protein ZOD2009_07794 [Haladaptatus paucihalophilus DX253]|uniref:Uncharacterized protein n=1 Tax=Haladaptatus paucihalophilus DX253 TaxID=797209 RepID=E7QRY6_HALPU|nr:hypothetical protein [Haladaptatus paucihalophilus]EFW92755.1 hypothetical protein ZOD2009_07794 [Haladaptatus paucihalophilus DX253]